MKHILFTLCLLLPTTMTATQQLSGSSKINDMTFDELSASGSTTLERCIVKKLKSSGSLKFTSLTAQETLNASGRTNGEELTGGDCIFSGSTSLSNSKIKSMKTSGSTHAQHVIITGELSSSGSLKGEHLKISGLTDASGSLVLKECSIQELSCPSKTELHNTKTKNITVEKKTYRTGLQSDIPFFQWFFNLFSSKDEKEKDEEISKLYVYGNTVIDGDITFKSEHGIIYLEKSVIIKGKLHGGTLSYI